MKKWIIRIVGAVIVLIIIAVVVVFLSLNVIVKKGVETVGPPMTKTTVTLGSAAISPFSGSGTLKDLLVGNPDGYKTPFAVKFGSIKVAVSLPSVASSTITVNEINIQDPEITFEGGFGGNNLSQLLQNVDGAGGSAPASSATPASGGTSKKFIVINGAEIHVSLTGLGGKEVTVPLPPLHLTNIGSEGNGVTASQLVDQILTPLLSSITEAVKNSATSLIGNSSNLTKGASGAIQNVGNGLKGLFH